MSENLRTHFSWLLINFNIEICIIKKMHLHILWFPLFALFLRLLLIFRFGSVVNILREILLEFLYRSLISYTLYQYRNLQKYCILSWILSEKSTFSLFHILHIFRSSVDKFWQINLHSSIYFHQMQPSKITN